MTLLAGRSKIGDGIFGDADSYGAEDFGEKKGQALDSLARRV
jgi:hypothetical protein